MWYPKLSLTGWRKRVRNCNLSFKRGQQKGKLKVQRGVSIYRRKDGTRKIKVLLHLEVLVPALVYEGATPTELGTLLQNCVVNDGARLAQHVAAKVEAGNAKMVESAATGVSGGG